MLADWTPTRETDGRSCAATIAGATVVCPQCGSDRLIPLTFTTLLNEDETDLPRRPGREVRGLRMYTTAEAHQRCHQIDAPPLEAPRRAARALGRKGNRRIGRLNLQVC